VNEYHFFRHDILKWGICMNRLLNVSILNEPDDSEVFNPHQPLSNRIANVIKGYEFTIEDERRMQTYIDKKFIQEYDLKTSIQMSFCMSNSSKTEGEFQLQENIGKNAHKNLF